MRSQLSLLRCAIEGRSYALRSFGLEVEQLDQLKFRVRRQLTEPASLDLSALLNTETVKEEVAAEEYHHKEILQDALLLWLANCASSETLPAARIDLNADRSPVRRTSPHVGLLRAGVMLCATWARSWAMKQLWFVCDGNLRCRRHLFSQIY